MSVLPQRSSARTVPVLAAFVVGAVAYCPLYCYPLLAPQFEARFHNLPQLGQMPLERCFADYIAACSPILGQAST